MASQLASARSGKTRLPSVIRTCAVHLRRSEHPEIRTLPTGVGPRNPSPHFAEGVCLSTSRGCLPGVFSGHGAIDHPIAPFGQLRAAQLPTNEVVALDDPFHEEGQPMQDSERGSRRRLGVERASAEDSNVSAKRRSRQRVSSWRSLARQGKLAVPSSAGSGGCRTGAAAGVRHARGGQRDGPQVRWSLDRGARSDGAPRGRYRRFEDRGNRFGVAGASMIVAGGHAAF